MVALLSGTGRATVAQHGPEDRAAAAAVAALAGPRPERAVLPPDLGRVTGNAVARVADLPRPPWLPVVSFLQISVDLLVALSVPPGHGHRYGEEHRDAWQALLDVRGRAASGSCRGCSA